MLFFMSVLIVDHQAFIFSLSSITEPIKYADFILYKWWRNAMAAEIQALKAHKTWTITELPTGEIPIGYKWVYKVKHKAYGIVEKCKVRLVTKGFTK